MFTVQYDYATFKLFHLSVLFRASVSSLSTFQEVNLGALHEERIRQMLLNEDPGKDWEYPILGFAVLNKIMSKSDLFLNLLVGVMKVITLMVKYMVVQCGGFWSLHTVITYSVVQDFNPLVI